MLTKPTLALRTRFSTKTQNQFKPLIKKRTFPVVLWVEEFCSRRTWRAISCAAACHLAVPPRHSRKRRAALGPTSLRIRRTVRRIHSALSCCCLIFPPKKRRFKKRTYRLHAVMLRRKGFTSTLRWCFCRHETVRARLPYPLPLHTHWSLSLELASSA